MARLPTLFDETPSGWISYPALRRFTSQVARNEGIPDLGLRFRDLNAVLISAVRATVLNAPTLNIALQRLSADFHIQDTGIRVGVQLFPDRARLNLRLPLPSDFPGHAISESRVVRISELLLQAYAGPAFTQAVVFLSASEDDLPFDLESAFGSARVVVGQRETALEFPRKLLACRKARFADPVGRRRLAATEPPPPRGSVSESLRACLEPYLPEEPVSIDLAAEISGLPVRTLQRRMKAEGTTFSRVVDDARCRVALSRLEAGDVGLAELAVQLGYSEHSAFTRAFHRWTGTTPRRYRVNGGGARPSGVG